MKRFGYLYEKIWAMENIQLAHLNAQRGKKHYKEVRMINSNQEFYLKKIQNMLKEKIYKTSNYVKMTKKTNCGKVREIYKLPYFPDRIVHHAIMQILRPIWYKTLIRDTYSSIKGRGIHDGVNRIKKALFDKENTLYCLKFDIKQYYPSINNGILKSVIRKRIKDSDVLYLLDEIIDSVQGVPIGNYLSQYFGNLYLSEYDHWAKEEMGIKYYFRYCDDIVILHKDKKFLHEIRKQSEEYLSESRQLQIKNNWQVFPVADRGIDFLGYRFYHNYVLLRRSVATSFKQKIKNLIRNWEYINTIQAVSMVMSYIGWIKYANCKNLLRSLIGKDIFWIIKTKCKDSNINNPLQGIV